MGAASTVFVCSVSAWPDSGTMTRTVTASSASEIAIPISGDLATWPCLRASLRRRGVAFSVLSSFANAVPDEWWDASCAGWVAGPWPRHDAAHRCVRRPAPPT